MQATLKWQKHRYPMGKQNFGPDITRHAITAKPVTNIGATYDTLRGKFILTYMKPFRHLHWVETNFGNH